MMISFGMPFLFAWHIRELNKLTISCFLAKEAFSGVVKNLGVLLVL